MLAPEIQDGLQQRRGRSGATTAVVIVGGQNGQKLITGPGLQGASGQVSGRAYGQVELPRDLRRGGPKSGHSGDGQPEREVGGARHRR
jgi:hypothetical protein